MTDPRFVHLCTRYLQGGSEQRLRDIVNSVPGEHVVIIGHESDLERARVDLPGVHIEQWSSLVRSPNPVRDGLVLARLCVYLLRSHFDLLFTHQSKGGMIGRVGAVVTRTPALHSVSMANTGPGYGRFRGTSLALAERVLSRGAKGYAVVGADLLDRIVDNGVPRARCSIVRSGARLVEPGVDRRERRAGLDQVQDITDRPWVVSVGSLEPRKCSTQLPALFTKIKLDSSTESAPVLLIAGDGPDAPQIMRHVDELGLSDSVRLLGHIDWATELIAAADVVVMMSKAEGLPQVLVQASGSNTPFACFMVDGAKELISLGARGSIVDRGDIDALAHEIAVWIACPDQSTCPVIDLSSWGNVAIADGYNNLVEDILVRRRFGS